MDIALASSVDERRAEFAVEAKDSVDKLLRFIESPNSVTSPEVKRALVVLANLSRVASHTNKLRNRNEMLAQLTD